MIKFANFLTGRWPPKSSVRRGRNGENKVTRGAEGIDLQMFRDRERRNGRSEKQVEQRDRILNVLHRDVDRFWQYLEVPLHCL